MVAKHLKINGIFYRIYKEPYPPIIMTCDKPDTGLELSLENLGPHLSPKLPRGLLDSPKREPVGISTGKYWCTSPTRSPSDSAKLFSGMLDTGNLPVVTPPLLMSTKKQRETASLLNLDTSHSIGILPRIGPELRSWRKSVCIVN